MCPFEHRQAGIDPGNDCIGRVESAVPTGSDTRIEKPTVEVLEHQLSQRPIAATLEREIEQIVERCDPLVSSKVGRHCIQCRC